ncbi:hypothetical protein L6164_025174 [Bauhinia variegata]|uniref:Uncharacterized protein n=1 Tax=Bauhinia variegata TaxID=167791 RepID=A0ACB9LZS7_BAUVA|nr:hypothetical protein L6164_025174 [Bauhinia variegata]
MREELDVKEKRTGSLMKEDMENLKGSEDHAVKLLSDCKRRVHELELELAKRKESEANLLDSLEIQTRQLELSQILLEESKAEIASLREKLQGFASNGASTKETTRGSETKAQPAKEKSNVAEDDDKQATGKVKTMLKEMSLLRNELKLATEAEEKSKKAMDDLALALKEVATEASHVKDKLTISQLELVHSIQEAERLRALLKSTEENYKQLLDETKKEADQYKNTSERLRLEAEESLLAWNEKETELVNCIKRAEDEKSSATAEPLESLRAAESKIKESKGENQKLRDILKQALNEANVAKEAAGIAKAENAQLQDRLAGKEEAINLIAHENEMLKINETTLVENIRVLKQLLAEAPGKEFKNKDKSPDRSEKINGDSINSQPVPQQEIEALNPDDFDQFDESPSRKRRALLRRFGDLLRRGYQRKEQSIV